MIGWKAVTVGLVIIIVVDTDGLALPVVDQVGVGLLGNFTAGYLAGSTLDNGVWSGPVAGSVSDIVVTLFAALLGNLFGPADGPLGGLLDGVGVLVAGTVLTFIFVIDSAIAKAVGARVEGWG